MLILNGILMDFWRRYGNTWIWLGYTQNLKGWTQIMRILLSYHLRRKPWKISATESTRTWSNSLNSECQIIILLSYHLNGIFWLAIYQIIFTRLLALVSNCSKNCSALVWGSSVKHKPQRVGKVCIRPAWCCIVTLTPGVRFLPLIHCPSVQEHELEDEDVVQIIKKI